jgi:hypothetical protein
VVLKIETSVAIRLLIAILGLVRHSGNRSDVQRSFLVEAFLAWNGILASAVT